MSLSSSSILVCPTTGEKQGWRCFGHLGALGACGVWGNHFAAKLPWHPGFPAGASPAAALAAPPACRASRAKSGLHPAPEQSVPIEGQTYCSLPGTSVESCPMRSKSERILPCDTDIFISFRLLPSASQTPQGFQRIHRPACYWEIRRQATWTKAFSTSPACWGCCPLSSPGVAGCRLRDRCPSLLLVALLWSWCPPPCFSHKHLED